MVELKCHNCGSIKEVDNPPKEFICKNCGAVNVVELGDGTADQACGCIAPTGKEWQEPAGFKIIGGEKIWITAQGSEMTKEEYIEAFGKDPEIYQEWMKNHKAPDGYVKLGKGRR